MRITKENSIGLVIDIQERLVPVMQNKDELVKNCGILVSGLQELGVPLLVTQQYTKGLGETVDEIKSVIADFQSIEKRDFSCCDEATVAERLQEAGRKIVLILGIESHVCVLQTALDLKENGYTPVVVMDCVSSRSEANKQLAMERFRYEDIMMTSYESALFELTRSSSAPEFRAISKLVK